ncbi:hypothetical protein [Streptomyces sp. NPDC048282]|uniref:hypothetical protein n=1 Tax=Streptomyces sp. NPDC048282 TaxID=3365528 RepID=UPI003713303C
MRKYIDDVAARRALETAAQHADKARDPLPFVWTGASWATPGGEWRDLPLIRKGVGDWLADVVAGLRWHYAPAIEAGERRADLERQAESVDTSALLTEAGARALLHQKAASLRQAAAAITTPPAPFALETLQSLDTVASEMLSAPDGRATHLLSLASQFDAFRAPLRDPAEWVKRLGSAPHSVHVRTSAVWEAFCAAEPVLARSLGTTGGKRALFAAMDGRFGARRKLAGYEGWRGVALNG